MTTTMRLEQLTDLGLPAPGSVERLDQEARHAFAKVPADNASEVTPPAEMDPAEVLRQSARFLDLWRAVAGVAEAADLVGAVTFGDVRQRAQQILDRARLLTRMDPLAIISRDPLVAAAARRPHHKPAPDDPFPLVASPSFVRWVRSLVEFCPIEGLEALGEHLGMPGEAHRCRLSYDWLHAFVLRRTPGKRETLNIIGRAYAEGRLSLKEAAHLLSMRRADAVAWLEEYGYARDLKVIGRRSDAEREEIYARIRAERIARNGTPREDDQLVVRDVLATQRIEGVDARQWLPPDA